MTKIKEFKLPFAKNFCKFLKDNLEGVLELETLESNKKATWGDRQSVYRLTLNDQKLGDFRVFYSSNLLKRFLYGAKDIFYYGMAPIPEEKRLKEVWLIFSRTELRFDLNGSTKVEEVEGRRKDSYSSIPFP